MCSKGNACLTNAPGSIATIPYWSPGRWTAVAGGAGAARGDEVAELPITA